LPFVLTNTRSGTKYTTLTVYGKKSFLSTESDTKILQSIYFVYKVGIISSYSNIIYMTLI